MEQLEKKTTILFPPPLYKRLKLLAKVKGVSVGKLIREAVIERYGLRDEEESLRQVQAIGEMSLPVANWEKMERETIQGATEGDVGK